MKKLLLFMSVGMAAASVSAHPIDFDRIKHWTGTGENRAALVIQYNGATYGDDAYVWGYRWADGETPSGETMFKAICANSSRLSLLTQFTGSMGSTVNGIGMGLNQRTLDYVTFDFEKAKTFEFINFDYYNVNTLMGQTQAPGDETPALAQAAIDEAKKGSHVIQHPFDARTYGYPAYDYDCWRLSQAAADMTGADASSMKWRAAWYEGYWSYWTANKPTDDWMYSGSGFSGRTLQNGSVDGWSFTEFETAQVGGMGEGVSPCEGAIKYMPARLMAGGVDLAKAVRVVGDGLQEIPVVVSWGNPAKIDNVVYRLKFNGELPDVAALASAISAADPALTATVEGDAVTSVALDANGDGAFTSGSDIKVDGQWMLTEFEDALLLSVNPEVEPAYLFYLPAIGEEGAWVPEEMSCALSDNDEFIPVFVQPKETHDALNYMWYRRADDQLTHSSTSSDIISSVSTAAASFGRLTFKGNKVGDVYMHVRVRIGKGADYAYSNVCKFTLKEPEVPVTAISFRDALVESPLNSTIENPVTFVPENATFTKLEYKSSNTKAVTASATAIKTTTTAGEATVTVTSTWNPEVTASFDVKSSLVNPVTEIAVKGVEGDTIVLNPKRMIGIIGEFTPANADIKDFDMLLEGNGTSKEDYIATAYKVNYWDENNTRIQFFELSGHRVGECKLTLTAKDGSGYTREYIVRIEEQDHTPIEGGYVDGTIILNEEWFGHTNGGMNYITPEGEMMYQVYERENPGMSFGCTSQYGTIWAGKLVVASKQAVDGGDPLPGGGRLVVADANTFKRIGSIDDLMVEGESRSGDGRAVVGATPSKVYVGTSQGIYIVDIDEVKVIGKISGDSASDGDLYSGQIGDMVRAGKYAFAIKQSYGTYIIDVNTDQVVKTIEDASVQGITQSFDGNVWIATIQDGCSKFVCIDPATLDEVTDKTVVMPQELGTVACGWGAWRSTQFFGSKSENVLWFVTGGAGITGGSNGGYYRWEIGTNPTGLQPVFSLSNPKLQASNKRVFQKTYGTSRYDDRSGELIVMTCEDGASGHYRYAWTHFINPANGEILRTIALEPYYWFQSLPIFPDKYAPEILIENIKADINDGTMTLDLNEYLEDKDNLLYNINVSLSEAVAADSETEPAATVALEGKILTVTPVKEGISYITLEAESNGKTVSKTVAVEVVNPTGIEVIDGASAGSLTCNGHDVTFRNFAGVNFRVYDLSGHMLAVIGVDSDNFTARLGYAAGIYLLRGDNGVVAKIILD